MKRFVLGVLAAGALLGVGIQSQAQTLTYTLLADTPWTMTGVGGTGTGGTGTYDPSIINVLFPIASGPVQSLPVPTGLNAADDLTFPGMGAPSSFTNFVNVPVDFHFTLQDGAIIDTYHVSGNINGIVGYRADGSPFTTAAVTFTSITDTLGGIVTSDTVPLSGNNGYKVVTQYGPDMVSLWLQKSYQKPKPGQDFIPQGFVSTVPEPGAIALLASSCITGSVFLIRRIRRA